MWSSWPWVSTTAANPLAVLDQVGDVGDDNVHAEQFGLGKHEAGVDDDDVVAPANGHAVHAEFAEPAEGNNLQLSYWHLQSLMLAQREVHVETGLVPSSLDVLARGEPGRPRPAAEPLRSTGARARRRRSIRSGRSGNRRFLYQVGCGVSGLINSTHIRWPTKINRGCGGASKARSAGA
jgi:hypothetical protein